MPHPDSIPFCVGYAAWLGGICLTALEGVRRFRRPLMCYVLGLAALALTLGFVLWLESGLVSAGAWSAQIGPPYRQFRHSAFAVFLVLFVARGLYLLPANIGIKALLVSVVLVAVGLAYLVSESPVSKSKLNLLRVGMTTNEVEEILGPPSYTLSPPPGSRLLWDYDGLRLLRVSFDEHHRYQSYFYD